MATLVVEAILAPHTANRHDAGSHPARADCVVAVTDMNDGLNGADAGLWNVLRWRASLRVAANAAANWDERLGFDDAAGERFFDGALEVVDRGGLYEAGDDGLVFEDDLAGVGVAGDEDDRDAFFGNNFSGGEAVNDRHVEIDECYVDFRAVALIDQLLAIGDGAHNAVSQMLEKSDKSFANVRLVLGNGDADRRGSVLDHMFLEH